MKGHALRTNSFTPKEQNVTIQKKQGKKLKASMLGGIAKRWKVLSGQNKWKGLLDPLDPDLRRYIIHYGEMAQVGYDAFNWDRKSLYAGDCYYSKSQIFARTGYLKANPFRYYYFPQKSKMFHSSLFSTIQNVTFLGTM